MAEDKPQRPDVPTKPEPVPSPTPTPTPTPTTPPEG